MTPRIVLVAVLFLALGTTLLWFRAMTGQQAPAITVPIIDGRSLSLETLRGRPVLINFWATTCAVCLQEIPHLATLYRDLNPRGLELIAIAMAYDPPNRVVAMSRQQQIPYPVALDIDAKAAKAFGDVALTPTTILISPQGKITHRVVGASDVHQLRDTIERML